MSRSAEGSQLDALVGPRSLEELADKSHVVTSPYGARGTDHGVHASAGKWTEIADVHPIVLHERPKNIAILGEIFLCKGRHHTSGIRERHSEPCPITKSEFLTDPAVLDEPKPLGWVGAHKGT